MRILHLLLMMTLAVTSSVCQTICNPHCDGRDSDFARNPRSPASATIWGRVVQLWISDDDNMGFAIISNGEPGDEVWLDRSFSGGASWESGSKLGDITIPGNAREVATAMYNVDGSYEHQEIGALRACGKAGNRDEISCTSWARSSVHANTPIEAAANALMQLYHSGGTWHNYWWNAANCLTAIIDYMKLTDDWTYMYVISQTFEKNKDKELGNFCNEYCDDTAWWGLAWVNVYDLTGNETYLNVARITADFVYATYDQQCGGGVYWRTRRDYKNAITNELFFKLAAALHNRIPGANNYLEQALQTWNWFNASGMINSQNLINDGLTEDCQNNGQETWTYNQGVILGGLVELYKATGNSGYLDKAKTIADAVVSNSRLSPNGVLREPCEHDGCGADGPSFKGAFARNLGELNSVLPDRPYDTYLDYNSRTIYANRNALDQYGLHYAGPFEYFTPASQHSAFEMFTATLRT